MQSYNVPHILVIFGPTGVGKSDFAEQIAQHVPAEIINMDVGQLYTPLTIGTAKPNWRYSSITHHLFDVLDSPCDYNVATYRSRVLDLIRSLWLQGKVPILVGGSGFYLKSLFFPPTMPVVVTNNRVVTQENVHDYWLALQQVDPVRAAAIDKQDTYRIGRALGIWHATGIKPSDYAVSFEPPCSFTLLFLTRPRQELYDRINARVDIMMQQGWLSEVERLYQTDWESFLLKKKLIGYNELLDYLHSQRTVHGLENTITSIKQRTRHYAKRQHTFWRMLKQQLEPVMSVDQKHDMVSKMESIDMTLLNSDLYIKLLVQRLTDAIGAKID